MRLVSPILLVAAIPSLSLSQLSPAPNFDAPAVRNGEVALVDLDGDGDLDLYLSGGTTGFGIDLESYVYLNDGAGGFTLSAATSPGPVLYGFAEFADLDGDGDRDVVTFGRSEDDQNVDVIRSFRNDGASGFSEFDSGLPTAASPGLAFSDVDGDGDVDAVLTGNTAETGFDLVGVVYDNDGTGRFTVADAETLPKVWLGTTVFADFDGDGADELFVSGSTGPDTESARILFDIDGAGNFTEVPGNAFPALTITCAEAVDVDGDGDLDLVVAGFDGFDTNEIHVMINENGAFSSAQTFDFDRNTPEIAAILDADGDGDPDLTVASRPFTGSSEFFQYANDGTGTFTLADDLIVGDAGFQQTASGDVDGDGDTDLVISGIFSDGGDRERTELYLAGEVSSARSIAGLEKLDFTVHYERASGAVSVLFDAPSQASVSLELVDRVGRVVHVENAPQVDTGTRVTLATAPLASGVYVLRTYDERAGGTVAFVVP